MGKGDLRSPSTEFLVNQAKRGDREALEELIARYYETWLKRHHKKLGAAIRRLCDTEDFVQSALGEVMVKLPRLRNEAAFFSWVTSIIRHKVARKYRELGTLRLISLEKAGELPSSGRRERSSAEDRVSGIDTYIHTLEAILHLFRDYPEEMAAVSMKYRESLTLEEMVERLQKSRRTVQRWVATGTNILKGHLLPRSSEE